MPYPLGPVLLQPRRPSHDAAPPRFAPPCPLLQLPLEILQLIFDHLPQRPTSPKFNYVRHFDRTKRGLTSTTTDKQEEAQFPLCRYNYMKQSFESSPLVDDFDAHTVIQGPIAAPDLLALAATCRHLRGLIGPVLYANVEMQDVDIFQRRFELAKVDNAPRHADPAAASPRRPPPYKLTLRAQASSSVLAFVTHFAVHVQPNVAQAHYTYLSPLSEDRHLAWHQLVAPEYLPRLTHCKLVFTGTTSTAFSSSAGASPLTAPSLSQSYWTPAISASFDAQLRRYQPSLDDDERCPVRFELVAPHVAFAGLSGRTFLRSVERLELYVVASCEYMYATAQTLAQLSNVADVTLVSRPVRPPEHEHAHKRQHQQQHQQRVQRVRRFMRTLSERLPRLRTLAVRGSPLPTALLPVFIPPSVRSLSCTSRHLTRADEAKLPFPQTYPMIEELCLQNLQLKGRYRFPRLRALCIIDSHMDTREFAEFLDAHPDIERVFFMSIEARHLELALTKLTKLKQVHVGCICESSSPQTDEHETPAPLHTPEAEDAYDNTAETTATAPRRRSFSSLLDTDQNAEHFLRALPGYACAATLTTLVLPVSKDEVRLATLAAAVRALRGANGALTSLRFIEAKDWRFTYDEFATNGVFRDWASLRRRAAETPTYKLPPYVFCSVARQWHSPSHIFGAGGLRFCAEDYAFCSGICFSSQSSLNFCYECDLPLLQTMDLP